MRETRTLGYSVALPHRITNPSGAARALFAGKGQAVAGCLLGFIHSSAQIRARITESDTVTTIEPSPVTTHLRRYRADNGITPVTQASKAQTPHEPIDSIAR